MEITILFFLTSGLFLGWALGANDAANVFGTAVGTRMVQFTTAAMICGVFVILGAVFSGAGTTETLGKLGSVNALGGSFMAAFSAALAVYMMTKLGLPVSTTQSIVGSIIGWNLFSQTQTDTTSLLKILATWVVSPILAAIIAIVLFKLVAVFLRHAKIHLLRTDAYTRAGLLLAGAFGSYSLGANNIANVVGVFIPASPFTDFHFADLLTFSSTQQLMLLGGFAIAVGVFTYSKRVMLTVGGGLLSLSPIAAWVVVTSHSIVLFLFASKGLEHFLATNGLPTIPLVPVSSSQAVVGAIIGIGILKGGRGIRWRVLGGIGAGWVMTPLLAGLICFVGLFFLQNVFDQKVYRPVPYELSEPAIERMEKVGVAVGNFRDLHSRRFETAIAIRDVLKERAGLSGEDLAAVLDAAELDLMVVDATGIVSLENSRLTDGQVQAVRSLAGERYPHRWMLADALARISEEWRPREKNKVNKIYNGDLKTRLAVVFRTFRADQ